jgi:hypothetical protein
MSGALATPVRAQSGAATGGLPGRHARLWALTRIEGRRLVLHPLFLLGGAFSVLFFVTTDSQSVDRYQDPAGFAFQQPGIALWTFLVAFLAAQRAGRDAAEDLYESVPVPARTRTAAVLLSLACAATVTALVAATAWLVMVGLDGLVVIDGRRLGPGLLELAQGPLLVVTFGAFGVLLARWVPRTFAGPLGMFLLFMPPLGWLPWVVLEPRIPDANVSTGASIEWHLALLAGLGLLAGALALWRDDRRARIALLALAGLAATVAGAALHLP